MLSPGASPRCGNAHAYFQCVRISPFASSITIVSSESPGDGESEEKVAVIKLDAELPLSPDSSPGGCVAKIVLGGAYAEFEGVHEVAIS